MSAANLEDVSSDVASEYKAPPKNTVSELLSAKEGEDEALQRYKASLLGAASGSGATAAGEDARHVVVRQLAILINGRDPLMFDMTDEVLSGGLNVVLREGCEYRVQLTFCVQHEIVSGLKYQNVVSRLIPIVGKPLTVLTVDEMLGSYPPDPAKAVTVVFPRREWEQAPSGMTARAAYTCKTTLLDDDGFEHLKFSYQLTIKKDWE